MNHTFRNLAVTGVLTFGSMAAHAVVITHGDYSWDDSNNYVTNSVSGQEWLRWPVTNGQSINQAKAGFAADRWEVASNADMATLFGDFFGSVIWDTDENTFQINVGEFNDGKDPSSDFLELFGYTDWDHDVRQPNGTMINEQSFGHSGSTVIFGRDLDNDGLFNLADASTEWTKVLFDRELVHFADISGMQGDSRTRHDADFQSIGVGVAMTRRSTSVPEPTTLSLISLGLFGLCFLRKQKQS